MILSPLFWEWFNIWLVQVLKNLYNELKMVVVRGSENSSTSLHHGCMNQGNQTAHGSIEVSQCMPNSYNIPQTTVTQHINVNQINLPSINSVSVQYIPHHNTSSTLKHDQSSSRYSSSNCQLPSHHYRVVSQPRPVECYHPAGAAGTQYIPNTTGGVQTSGQPTLRVQPTPQPSAPPAPQQDISKTTMAGHNYPSQNQNSSNSRASQYGNFPYRQQQQQPQSTRSSTHPRQQQTQQQQPPYIPGATATTGPVVYPLMFQPPINIQGYQQPRSSTPYFPYLSYIHGYNTPPGHTPQYYYTPGSPQLPSQNAQTNPPSRNNPATLGGAPCTASVTAPTPTLPLQQPPAHIHPSISGTRPNTQKHIHRLAIIHPVTLKNILTDVVPTENSYANDNNEQQVTQQPEPTPNFAEEFNRRVSEAAKEPSSDSVAKTNVTKSVEMPISSMSNVLSQSNAINYTNSNNNKSEIYINEKILGPDVAAETSETPIVSAISDSPVIVPKMPMNVKQLQKSSDQSIVLDNENVPLKQHKSKNVPQTEDVDKSSSNIVINMNSTANSSLLQPVSSFTNNIMGMHHNAPVQVVAPTVSTILTPVTVPAHSQTVATTANTQGICPSYANTPQRLRETERLKSEEKQRTETETTHSEESSFTTNRPNGPTSLVISSVDSLSNAINPPTSQNNKFTSEESTKNIEIIKNVTNQETEGILVEPKTEVIQKEKTQIDSSNHKVTQEYIPSSFENSIRLPTFEPDNKETSSAFDAQTKLTQSISSVLRAQQTDSKMKDTNKTTDPDTTNGNNSETVSETVKEDINKNDKALKNQKNINKKSKKMANNNKESEAYENGKDETDKVVDIDENLKDETETNPSSEKVEASSAQPVFIPKYKYSEDQWSPFNKAGKKTYDIDLLKQIKDDPLSKNKPEAPLLEAWNVIRTTPMLEPLPFANISRPSGDMFFPFGKSSGTGSRSNTPRDIKRDGRNLTPSARGSMKMPTSSSSGSSHKPVIHVCLNDDVKLNESDSAWRPTRFVKPENVDEEELKTQELYKKFRGILNKLTPQKFDTLLDKVKALDINNQKRLEGVIDLVFEKAIEEPNFSKAYAAMCHKLSKLKVPADNPAKPDQCVNFRALIINKCQNQFQTDKSNEQVMKLEKEIAESSDPAKKKELQAMIEEEHRRIRMRSVGNVRFIGELYKLKMLTVKIMEYCMNYLIEILEEEKLECLCKLLTTIGEQIENEPQDHLDPIFKKMQDIVDRRSNKISSRVRFMIQDVIELRKRKWVTKSVIDTQPKMMDQIQKEAEQQQRHIELMNANPMGGFRRDDGRGKRGGDNRRPNTNSYMDNSWKTTRTNFAVDTSKLKAVSQKMPIKLAPHNSGWNHGSGTKNTAQTAGSSNSMISLTKNMYSILENVSTEPTSLRGTHDMTPTYHSKGASIERSTFNSRPEFGTTATNRSDSMGLGRSSSGSRSTSAAPPPAPAPAETVQPAQATTVPQEPLPDSKRSSVKSMVDLCLIHSYYDEMLVEFKEIFKPEHHAAVISEIFNITFDKSSKEIDMIVNIVQLLVSTNTVSADNLLEGMKETFDCAPDLHIDIPRLYDYLGKFVVPHIEKKHITFVQLFKLCNTIISSNHGHLLLKAIIRELKESMGPKFVKSKWQESNLKLEQWMSEDQVPKWIEDSKFEFLEGEVKPTDEENKKILTPAETQSKLLQLMNADESCECIKGWAQDKFGKSCNEEWFMRCLIQAICEHALFGPERRDVPHFNQDRMNKYAGLIQDFGETKQSREAICLFGIQQLIQRLEHPQGLSLEIFQYLHDQYIISLEGFLAWWESDKEPEGKGVMSKALTSFFTSINAEVENEDSCSED